MSDDITDAEYIDGLAEHADTEDALAWLADYIVNGTMDSVRRRPNLAKALKLARLGAAVEDCAKANNGEWGRHQLCQFAVAVLLCINPHRTELRRIDHQLKAIDARPSRYET